MDHSVELIEQNRLLGVLYRGADPDVAVPTCPGWTLRKLITHVGRGDRWAASIVTQRSDSAVDIRTVPDGKPPADRDEAASWLAAGAAELLAAVASTGRQTPVWTFTGPQPAGWWVRRRLHEATVHRADAALAVGTEYEVSSGTAADGVSEWLDLIAARPGAVEPMPLAVGETLHLHATDVDLAGAGEWLVHGEAVTVSWEHGHAKGQVAVRGRAADLLLALLRRRPADDGRLQVLGDAQIWQTWLDRTGF